MRVVGHGGCWLSTRHPTWPGRRICRIRRHRFQPSAVVHRALRRCHRQDRGQLACRQRQGLRSDALVLQTESARPERRGADRMLDLAGCGASGLPEHPLGRVRNGPGRCGQRAHAAPGGLFVRERQHPFRRRAGPRLRCERARRRIRQRCRHGLAQVPTTGASRRRLHSCRDQGIGHQQRRWPEDEFPGHQGRRPARLHACRAGQRRRVRRQPRLYRGAWHGYGDGRSDRSPCAQPVVSQRDPASPVLRNRIGQEQHRPSRYRSRHGESDKSRDVSEIPAHSAVCQFHHAESQDRFRKQPIPRQHRFDRMAAGRYAAACRDQLSRHRRHQCLHGAGRTAAAAAAAARGGNAAHRGVVGKNRGRALAQGH